MSQNIDGKVVVITGAQCRSDVAFAALTRQGGQLESDDRREPQGRALRHRCGATPERGRRCSNKPLFSTLSLRLSLSKPVRLSGTDIGSVQPFVFFNKAQDVCSHTPRSVKPASTGSA